MQWRRRSQRVHDVRCLGIKHYNMAIRGPCDDLGIVASVDRRVNIRCVPPILLQGLSGFEAVCSGSLIEGCREQQRGVLGPRDRRDPLPMRALEAPSTLAGGNPPDLQLAILTPSGEQLGVLREGGGDDRLVVHHETACLLVLEVLAQDGRLVVPDLHKAVDGARDAVLPVGGEARALRVGLLAEADRPRDRRGAELALLHCIRGHPAEDVDPRVGGQEAGVLLPLHGLAHERQQPRRRGHGHVLAERLRQGAPALLPRHALEGLARVKLRPAAQGLEAQEALGAFLLQSAHRRRLPEQVLRRLHLAQLQELQDDLGVEVMQDDVGQAEVGDRLQDGVPAPVVDVTHEPLERVHGVQRHTGLLLHRLQCAVQAILLAELQHQPYDLCTLHTGRRHGGGVARPRGRLGGGVSGRACCLGTPRTASA
mmetsp:Transcript_109373/g.327105  ORF Transcript_109373/g.327105 Transcript_109373/m.327105 type:complete len:425 (+) Transcript_109373:448-1722(+)